MHTLRLTLLALATALPWPARAETQWTTVTLAPGITMDLPTVVADEYNPPGGSADELMFVTLKRGEGTMDCLLTRVPYTKDLTREKTVALVTAKKHGNLCLGAGQQKSVTDLGLEAIDAATNSGRPAGACVASYTDASKKPPGRVSTTFVVVDEAKLYMLSCEIAAETQDDAMYDWFDAWAETIARMEKSLHLP